MANRAGAAAGVNGDFFDIDSTQASLGGEIQAGQLIKSADFSGWAHVGVTKDGIGRLVDLTLQATASLNGTDKPVVTLNAASSGGVPADSIVAYTSAWGSQIRGRSMAGRRQRRRGPGPGRQGRRGPPRGRQRARSRTARSTSSAVTPAPTPSRRSSPATRSR